MTAPMLEVTGRKVAFDLHDGQMDAIESEARIVLVLAGTQSGKTVIGPIWLYCEMQKRGPGDYMVVTPTFTLLELKALPEFRRLFEDIAQLGDYTGTPIRKFVVHPAGARALFGHNPDFLAASQTTPTVVYFGHASDPNGLESATIKGAWLDEAGQTTFKPDSWEAIQRRGSIHEARYFITTTPYILGWLKVLVYDAWKDGSSEVDVINFRSIDNPAFPVAEYERQRSILPGWKFRMFYDGMFERPAGAIYEDFIDEYREQGGHKVHPFDLPTEWPRYVGIDFGAVNTATIWIAKDPAANVFYLYHETHEGGLSSAQHATKAKATATGVNIVGWHGGAKSEDQQRWDWGTAGIPVQEPEVSDVEAGIDRVIALFKTMRLYIFDTCKGVLDELGRYSRELDEMQQPTEKIKDKERYHRLDALRYGVQGLLVPAPATGSVERQPVPPGPMRSLFGRMR